MRGKIRIKKAEGGDVFVIKTLRLAGTEMLEDLSLRREEAKKKKTERNKAKRQAQKKK